jgi:hypothetical protein
MERNHYGEWKILDWILEKCDGAVCTRSTWLRTGASKCSCEHGNESLGSIKFW